MKEIQNQQLASLLEAFGLAQHSANELPKGAQNTRETAVRSIGRIITAIGEFCQVVKDDPDAETLRYSWLGTLSEILPALTMLAILQARESDEVEVLEAAARLSKELAGDTASRNVA